jgi:hypothetical protein
MTTFRTNAVNRIDVDAEGNHSCPECGALLNAPRSHKHLGALFVFIKHAFENWPESHEFQPDNTEHLRAWLLVKAGHRAPQHVFRFANKRELQIVMGFVQEEMRVDRARGVYGWPVIQDGGLVIVRPKSIAFNKLSEKAFCKISDGVFKVILDETGIGFEEWKEGLNRVAA